MIHYNQKQLNFEYYAVYPLVSDDESISGYEIYLMNDGEETALLISRVEFPEWYNEPFRHEMFQDAVVHVNYRNQIISND